MGRINPNQLLVEGEDERRVISHFIDQYVVWGNSEHEFVVQIKTFNGIEDLLKPRFSAHPGLIFSEFPVPA